MTTIEIVEYLGAMGSAEITDGLIRNNSPLSLWFDVDGAVHELMPYGQLVMGEARNS